MILPLALTNSYLYTQFSFGTVTFCGELFILFLNAISVKSFVVYCYTVVHLTRFKDFSFQWNSSYIMKFGIFYISSLRNFIRSALNRYENSPWCNRYVHLLACSLVWARWFISQYVWIWVKFITKLYVHLQRFV